MFSQWKKFPIGNQDPRGRIIEDKGDFGCCKAPVDWRENKSSAGAGEKRHIKKITVSAEVPNSVSGLEAHGLPMRI
jgi:hypothetical protein